MSDRDNGYSKLRRARNRAAGVCINGKLHGPATHGVLCERCRLVHRGKAPDKSPDAGSMDALLAEMRGAP